MTSFTTKSRINNFSEDEEGHGVLEATSSLAPVQTTQNNGAQLMQLLADALEAQNAVAPTDPTLTSLNLS
eukprot:CAMPEP_0196578648 /NCGR_PEP_ID=MMETSP1081-20130531/7514_1 /TAXON_ID=36882 /ORGANISM="Pyramimonas amylifera, Strain CCMP720" /LENGTH=69 /DNA_ID=CAMNT_0041897931 /DNA_START=32 /DNA_END=237 /DNA_ORIENTATION=+